MAADYNAFITEETIEGDDDADGPSLERRSRSRITSPQRGSGRPAAPRCSPTTSRRTPRLSSTGRPTDRRGRDGRRQDEHGRVRDGNDHRDLRVRPHEEPCRPGARPRRLLGRVGGGGRRGRGRRPSAPTRAGRCAVRPRSAASSGSSPPTGSSRGTGSSRTQTPSNRSDRSRAPSRRRPPPLTSSLERTRTTGPLAT